LVLAFISTYGVLAYQVSRRTQEVGVRRALGATRAEVALGVVRTSAAQAALGITLGLAGALTWSEALRRLLFEITPYDPSAYVYSIVALTAVPTLAALLPAAKAASVSPVAAIRGE
jgi:ABC-type antimicrobial peptide transport system permease subunit